MVEVLLICRSRQPKYAQYFNVIDSFDTHARIPEHFADVDKAAADSKHVAVISVGWDPGMFFVESLVWKCNSYRG